MPNSVQPNRRHVLTAGAVLPLTVTAIEAKATEKRRAAEGFSTLQVVKGGANFTAGDLTVDILFAASGTVSVVKYATGSSPDAAGFFLSPDSLAGNIKLSQTAAGASLVSDDLEVRINKRTMHIGFYRAGIPYLSDTSSRLDTQTFDLPAASDLYGLGQFRDAMPNYRDKAIYLAQANMDAVNPFLFSPNGLGLLWDTHTDTHLKNAGTQLTYSNTAPLIRYHVCLGKDADAVIAGYRRLTGKAPLLGKWAYGFWQSQERYNSQAELTGILDGYRDRKLPIDVIVQDWHYWGDDAYFSGMVWDKVSFADPKGMCDHVHAQHAHVIASVWPAFGPASAVFKDLDAESLLFKGPHWSGGKVLDITSPRARDIYWKHVNDGLLSVGLDGLWTDGNEPEFMATGSRYVTAKSYAENGDCAAGPIKDHLMTFSYYQTRLFYQNQRAQTDAKRPLTLTRKVYAGQQAFGTVSWSGDIFAGWQTLNYQIVAAQQIALSGLPYWTNDIGGFLVTHRFPGGLENKAYRELYVRWFQFGAFMPVFRAHGTQIRRELWAMGSDGDPHYEALKKALNLRYTLMPYIYSQAAAVTYKNESFLRPLVMDYAADGNIAGHPNQYMFGRNLLVAVVNTPLEAEQENYFEFIPNYAAVGIDGPAPEITFYEGANFEKQVDTRHGDDLKMSWFGDIPFNLRGKPYSARWKGKIIAQESGSHRIQITTQGLIKFSLDGVTKIASKGTDTGTATQANGGVSFGGHDGDNVYGFDMVLKAGQAYTFELTQSQPTPDIVSLWVEWIRPSRKADLHVSPDKTLDVYLPAGSDWYGLMDGQRYKGGQTLKVRPALSDIPVYVKAGSILPQTPGIQYATQKPEQIELHIYAGADGAFTLYDDEGDGHDYEKGKCRHWPLTWSDAARKLTFAPADGTYPGADATTTFAVTVHDGNSQLLTKTVTVSASESVTLELS